MNRRFQRFESPVRRSSGTRTGLDILSRLIVPSKRYSTTADVEAVKAGGTVLLGAYVRTGSRLVRNVLPIGKGPQAASVLAEQIGRPPYAITGVTDARDVKVKDIVMMSVTGTSQRGDWEIVVPTKDVPFLEWFVGQCG